MGIDPHEKRFDQPARPEKKLQTLPFEKQVRPISKYPSNQPDYDPNYAYPMKRLSRSVIHFSKQAPRKFERYGGGGKKEDVDMAKMFFENQKNKLPITRTMHKKVMAFP